MNRSYSAWLAKLEAEAERRRKVLAPTLNQQPLERPAGPVLDAQGVPIKNEELRLTSIVKPKPL